MLLHVFLLLTSQGIFTQAADLIARVSSGGVTGAVTFTSDPNDVNNVAVGFDLGGPNVADANTWSLRSYRFSYAEGRDGCSLAHLGSEEFNGAQVANKTISRTLASIEGLSIALFKTGQAAPVACANVEKPGEYVTARAVFRQGDVLGEVTLRQQASSESALTRLNSDLYFKAGTSGGEVDWRIVQEEGCSTLGTVYDPSKSPGECGPSNQKSCAVGDLGSKGIVATVGNSKGSQRYANTDTHLPLSGVVGKTIQIFTKGTNTLLACASIRPFTTRIGLAEFDQDGVSGSIKLTQKSPFDTTTVSVKLTNLQSKAGGYHVHKWPVPQRSEKDESLCAGDVVSGHFNPFSIDYTAVTPPAPGTGSDDMYEVGDLSGKFGLLNDLSGLDKEFTDSNLQLFGVNSVLGRSIVIHKNLAGGPRWICSNIRDTSALTFALATFTYPVIGHALLAQRTGEEKAETWIYARLDYGDGTSAMTTGHSWAVYDKPAGRDSLTNVDRCSSAGSTVFNPDNSSSSAQCSPPDPLLCRVGDLTGKHGALSIRKGASTPAIDFYTDLDLPLQGPRSVLGKAIVLKAENSGTQTLSCANIERVYPLSAEATDWGSQSDLGSVTFTQQVGVIDQPTSIALNLKSLPSDSTVSYQVESGPTVTNSSGRQCDNLGGVYNPFQADGTGTAKKDKPVGDLTSKFGALSTSVVQQNLVDPNLDLWGYRGVIGRALALKSRNDYLGCADVTFKAKAGGKLFTAVAKFTQPIVGEIKMSQYVFEDGAMAPTTVVVNLRVATGEQTQKHNWHTHVKKVGDDATSTTTPCASTGPHYNPFMVDVKNNYTECSPSNPLRCELGDQSNKLGTYDMGSGPVVFSDVYLPLTGPYNVIGRSFVVHVADRGAARLACADILPATLSDSLHMTIKTPSPLDKSAVAQKIAMALNTPEYGITVEWTSADDHGCTGLHVFFLGFNSEDLKQKFLQITQTEKDKLGDYAPHTCSAYSALVSIITLLLSLFIGRVVSS